MISAPAATMTSACITTMTEDGKNADKTTPAPKQTADSAIFFTE